MCVDTMALVNQLTVAVLVGIWGGIALGAIAKELKKARSLRFQALPVQG